MPGEEGAEPVVAEEAVEGGGLLASSRLLRNMF